MKIGIRYLGAISGFAAAMWAGCSSQGSAPSPERLAGEYAATTAGSLSIVTFVDTTHYWTRPSGPCPGAQATCEESGTYAFSASFDAIAFTSTKTGKTTSLPFAAVTTATLSAEAARLRPLGGGLTGGDGGADGGVDGGTDGGVDGGGDAGVDAGVANEASTSNDAGEAGATDSGGGSLTSADGGGLVGGTPVTLVSQTSVPLVTGFTMGGQTFAAATCGTCPTGFTCGAANGTSVCFSPTGVPKFSNVVVIMMENTTLPTLKAAGNTPYLDGLGQTWATSSNYHGVTHPSLRNYLALTSGDPQGIGSDQIANKLFCDCHPTGSSCGALNCVVAGIPLGNCGCPISARNVADDLEAKGLTWRDYGEGMGSACNVTDSSSLSYAARHNPFLYYDDIQMSSRCAANVVDYSNFATDLASNPMNFSFIAPNLIHDMHNPFPASSRNYANGDQWLSSQVPAILASAPWQPGGAGLLVIVWDEDDLSGGLTQSTDNPIPMFFISPLAKSGGYVSSTQNGHYNLLATIEDAFGLPRLLNAASAQPMSDFFVNSGPPGGSPASSK